MVVAPTFRRATHPRVLYDTKDIPENQQVHTTRTVQIPRTAMLSGRPVAQMTTRKTPTPENYGRPCRKLSLLFLRLHVAYVETT
mmetsp:Transcript_10435/g.17062  ORF Transcript_10435/g.17062 Transcript_10435/m.17062 type:complete len:84 (-) Transcript_10435:170-421(-)